VQKVFAWCSVTGLFLVECPMLSVGQQPTTTLSIYCLYLFTTPTGLTEWSCLEGIELSQSIHMFNNFLSIFSLVWTQVPVIIQLLVELRVNPQRLLTIIVFNRPVLRPHLLVLTDRWVYHKIWVGPWTVILLLAHPTGRSYHMSAWTT